MIVKEIVTIHGQDFDRTYSSLNFMIERDEVLYIDAIDPLNSGREYTETDIPIEEPTDEDYAEAGKILMGVIE